MRRRSWALRRATVSLTRRSWLHRAVLCSHQSLCCGCVLFRPLESVHDRAAAAAATSLRHKATLRHHAAATTTLPLSQMQQSRSPSPSMYSTVDSIMMVVVLCRLRSRSGSSMLVWALGHRHLERCRGRPSPRAPSLCSILCVHVGSWMMCPQSRRRGNGDSKTHSKVGHRGTVRVRITRW